MPIVYVHGVAVRDRGEAGYEAVQPFLTGLDWPDVEPRLRQYLAPVLSDSPEGVRIVEAFWGDLGAAPQLLDPVADEVSPDPAALTPAALAQELEERVCDALPLHTWPQAIQIARAVARSKTWRAVWACLPTPQERWSELLDLTESELRRHHAAGAWPLLAVLGKDLHSQLLRRVRHLRGPVEAFLPYFVGDVLDYPLRRGTPQKPGPIPQRLMEALREAQTIKQQTGEPIVLLSHSMGSQLIYDVLSAYTPACPALRDLKIDFWASAGGQLGLFAGLRLFTQPPQADHRMPPLSNLDFLWNVWSPADVLSFQAAPTIPEARDISMPLTDDPLRAHMAYITTPLFYEILASKLAAELGKTVKL